MIAKWSNDEDQVKFQSTIDDKQCSCNTSSTTRFFRESHALELKLVSRGKTKRDDVSGLVYQRQVQSEVGKAFYASASEDELEGSMGELYDSDYHHQTNSPFETSGAMQQSTKDSFRVAYSAVKKFLTDKKLSSKKLDDRQVLLSVDNFDDPLDGPSITLSQAIALISYATARVPKRCLITGQLSVNGHVGGVEGLQAKAEAAEVNNLKLIFPKENEDEMQRGSNKESVNSLQKAAEEIFLRLDEQAT